MPRTQDKIRARWDTTDSKNEDSTSYIIPFPDIPSSQGEFEEPSPSQYKVESEQEAARSGKSLTTTKVIPIFPTSGKIKCRGSGVIWMDGKTALSMKSIARRGNSGLLIRQVACCCWQLLCCNWTSSCQWGWMTRASQSAKEMVLEDLDWCCNHVGADEIN